MEKFDRDYDTIWQRAVSGFISPRLAKYCQILMALNTTGDISELRQRPNAGDLGRALWFLGRIHYLFEDKKSDSYRTLGEFAGQRYKDTASRIIATFSKGAAA